MLCVCVAILFYCRFRRNWMCCVCVLRTPLEGHPTCKDTKHVYSQSLQRTCLDVLRVCAATAPRRSPTCQDTKHVYSQSLQRTCLDVLRVCAATAPRRASHMPGHKARVQSVPTTEQPGCVAWVCFELPSKGVPHARTHRTCHARVHKVPTL